MKRKHRLTKDAYSTEDQSIDDGRELRVGDMVSMAPVTFGDRGEHEPRRAYPGRVGYVHPEGRYFMVEFRTRGGVIRECFIPR